LWEDHEYIDGKKRVSRKSNSYFLDTATPKNIEEITIQADIIITEGVCNLSKADGKDGVVVIDVGITVCQTKQRRKGM
jgi:5,10-methylene-tetrahydrofolate dehydrogenase/methenyl tetrahydrofolate cyclohydrolase